MTATGDSILSEYVNEVKEHIEDDKNLIRISQLFSITHSFWRLFLLSTTLFFNGFIVILVMLMMFIDQSTLEHLRQATNEEILSSIRVMITLALTIAFLGFIIMFTFTSRRYFKNKKQERLNREQERIDLIKTIIQINEELLHRHKLIREDHNND